MPIPKMRLRIGKRWIYGEPTTFERMKEGFEEFVAHAEKAVCHVVGKAGDAYDHATERLAALRAQTQPEPPEAIGSGWEMMDTPTIPSANPVDEVVEEDWLIV